MDNPAAWNKEGNFLSKTFTFKNFLIAVEFINNLATVAEKMNHHPDIELFSYKKVKIKLTTHEVGKITEKDIELAKQIDKLFLKS